MPSIAPSAVQHLVWRPFRLPALPYAIDALAPTISARTLALHHGRHHRGYVAALNRAIVGTGYAGLTLARIIVATHGRLERRAIYRNAAQSWNHAFQWRCLRPDGGGDPPAALRQRMIEAFGGVSGCRRELNRAAGAHFGSGWLWLALDAGELVVRATADADNPLTSGVTPLFVVDLWEHAYYLDHQQRRDAYVAAVIDRLADWGFADRVLRKLGGERV